MDKRSCSGDLVQGLLVPGVIAVQDELCGEEFRVDASLPGTCVMLSQSASDVTSSDHDLFTDLVTADEEWLRAEFDAIIEANFAGGGAASRPRAWFDRPARRPDPPRVSWKRPQLRAFREWVPRAWRRQRAPP